MYVSLIYDAYNERAAEDARSNLHEIRLMFPEYAR